MWFDCSNVHGQNNQDNDRKVCLLQNVPNVYKSHAVVIANHSVILVKHSTAFPEDASWNTLLKHKKTISYNPLSLGKIF